MKRAFNPKLSQVYEARRQRIPPIGMKRSSDGDINLSNVETLLGGIMDDLDTILGEWEENPQSGNRLAGVSSGTHNDLKHDTAWLRAALSKLKNTKHYFESTKIRMIIHPIVNFSDIFLGKARALEY